MRPFLTTNKPKWISQETKGTKEKGVIFVLYKKSTMWLHDMRGEINAKKFQIQLQKTSFFGDSMISKYE